MEHSGNLPQHVAVIMDGNGRWAKKRGLPRIEGHRRGFESTREVIRTARGVGIKYLTLYAFSKENWARPKDEISFLMSILSRYLDAELKELKSNNIRFNVIGKLDDLPDEIRIKVDRNIAETRDLDGLVLTLAISYSSRMEILDAVKNLCRRVKAGELSEQDISEELFSNELYTAGIPDPDLLIRTSGEQRISNFLLWQISYTELYVSQQYWPEFRKPQFLQALDAYEKRERRFGRAEKVVVSQ